MIDVSIIIPCLNGVKYLKDCMNSLINQTIKNIEILFVDSGSTDGTLEVVADYIKKDKRIRLINTEIKSMGYQYNLGIENSVGEYVGFCEADDYVDKDMFEQLYGIAKEYNADYVKADFNLFMGNGSEIISMPAMTLPKHYSHMENTVMSIGDYKEMCNYDTQMWTGIYNRDFICKNHIKLNETPGAAFQDTDFTLQTQVLAERAVYTRKNYYYRRDNDASSIYNAKSLRYALDEFIYMIDFMDKHMNKKMLKGTVFKQCINVFMSKYEMIVRRKIADYSSDELLHAFRKEVLRAFKGTEISELYSAGLLGDVRIISLNKSVDVFKQYIHTKVDGWVDTWGYFLKKVAEHGTIAIIGCGEVGKSLCIVFAKRGLKTRIVLADNNASMHGTSFYGIKIKSVKDIASSHGEDTIFVVGNANIMERMTIEEQLIRLGIDRELIITPPGIGSRMAMDMSVF